MNKGIQLRTTIHNILYDIKKFGRAIDSLYVSYKVNKLNSRDISFINNVSLNTMRYNFHTQKILGLYAKKKPKMHEEILLCSAITQIVFLNFKEYAVINSSVEIAKKLKIYHGFVNAILKRIAADKDNLKIVKISFKDLPTWFKNNTKNLSTNEQNEFLKNFFKEPNLHIVFKNNNFLENFEEEIELTSKVSGFLKKRKKVQDILSYKKGSWWVQDFSSAFPLINIDKDLIKKKCIDICAAPGGKSFQVLSKNKNLVLNDKSIKRISLLKTNLRRLKYNPIITNYDFKDLDENKKYDFIILDAPCSSTGTIRKNPEIFFKKKSPDFEKLIELQKKMLDKASIILKNNGVILYMVCSFLKIETTDQIENFLKRNNNFYLNNFYLNKENLYYKKQLEKKYMLTIPSQINNFNIDGFFAAYIKKR